MSKPTVPKPVNLHEEHRKRLTEKFRRGDSLTFHELLELLLFFSRPRVNTNEIGHDLIHTFGSFHGVFEADSMELEKVNGIGENSSTLIKLVYALIKAYIADLSKPVTAIANSEEAGDYFRNRMQLETKEKQMVLLLDNSGRIIDCKTYMEGVVNYSPECNRSLFEIILGSNAAGIYIAHNHPLGAAVPSNEDLTLTREIRDLCQRLSVDFLDHIIVAGSESCSALDYLERRERSYDEIL